LISPAIVRINFELKLRKRVPFPRLFGLSFRFVMILFRGRNPRAIRIQKPEERLKIIPEPTQDFTGYHGLRQGLAHLHHLTIDQAPFHPIQRKFFLVKEMPHLENQCDVVRSIDPLSTPIFPGAERRYLSLPVPEHMRFNPREISNLANRIESFG
jgi:hypothetical protein